MRSFRFFVHLTMHVAKVCKCFEAMKKESVIDMKNGL